MTLATAKILQSRTHPMHTPAAPPLQNGDRLSDAEFRRRYADTPESVKAELVDGIVYMTAPVFEESHGGPHADLMGWLTLYRAMTPGTRCADNTSLRLKLGELPQPDAYLRILPTHGGKTETDEEGYVVGAPELIAEVAASSVNYDLHAKLSAYQRSGVREYVVWRTFDSELDWFVLRGGRYQRLRVGSDGIHRSRIFPGLWLAADALLKGDIAKVLSVAQQGTSSPEHASFVRRLQKAAGRSSIR